MSFLCFLLTKSLCFISLTDNVMIHLFFQSKLEACIFFKVTIYFFDSHQEKTNWYNVLYDSDTIKSTHNRIIRLYSKYVMCD